MRLVHTAKIFRNSLSRLKETTIVSYKILNLYWKTEKLLFILNLIVVLLPAILPFVTAYIFKLVIDAAVVSLQTGVVDYQKLYYLLAVLLVVGYFSRLSNSLQGYVQKMFYLKFPITVYQLVLNKISSLDMQYFEDSDFRDLLQKAKESFTFRPHQMANVIMMMIQDSVRIIIASVAILTLNPLLAGLIFIIALPDFLNQVLFSRFNWTIWNQGTPRRKKMNYLTNLLESAHAIKELKIFQTKDIFLKEVNETQIEFYNENKGVAKQQIKVNFVLDFFDSLANVGIAIYIIFEAIARHITIGDISFYQNVVGNFNNGVGGLFRNITNIFDHSLYVKSVFDVLKLEPKIIEKKDALKVDFDKTPTIEFKNVTFAYPGSKHEVFKDFSVTLKPGERVAFVGENGAGKTTLVKLLARFYDVDEGEILIDGVNLKDLDLNSWFKSLGILFQDFIQYEYPVKDNIFFGRVWGEENLEKVIEAAKDAGADPMIRKFDEEYEQMLGKTFEGGIELSGGQWQKIALARAFFRSAPVLILDEPTASIDAKAESEIFNRVEKLSKDKTVIIISHRFSTVRNADRIIVLDKGKVIESGDHATLLKLKGRYAKLFQLQAKGYQ